MSRQHRDQQDTHHHHDHPGFDPQRLLAMEERRRGFMPPEPVLRELLTETSWFLLDVGCGSGYYSIPAAKLLPDGRVYALDVQENMVRTTLDRAQKAGFENVEGIVASSDRIPLGNASVDAALVAMVFHDLPEKSASLAEIKRVLKPGSTVSMVEFDRVESDFGPPMGIRVTPDELEQALETAGFVLEELRHSEAQPALYFVRARSPHV